MDDTEFILNNKNLLDEEPISFLSEMFSTETNRTTKGRM